MDVDLLVKLSNSDALAGNEDEVRELIQAECTKYLSETFRDGLGSLIFHKPGPSGSPKIMFMAHMDEVGFIVRSISDDGLLYVMPIGNVVNTSKDMQLIRIHTSQGKVRGVLNSIRDKSNQVLESYVDIGCSSENDVRVLGVSEGDFVYFATDALVHENGIVSGKAMDDRAGCFVLIQAVKELFDSYPCDIHFAFTSSEEVGARGGKTVTELVQPDLLVAIDTANYSGLGSGFKNHRILGAGPMLVYYDKTLAPKRRLLSYIQKLLEDANIPYQKDIFAGGGTDAGTGHLVNAGRLAMVLGIPLRYCHGSCSFVQLKDLKTAAHVIQLICSNFTEEVLRDLTN